MQLVWAERSYPITGGIMASLVFHVLLALLIVLGVPSFFKVEELPEPPGIEATIVSDITAAPKVDKAGKLQDKPKPPTPPAPEVKKPEPPKPAAQATPSKSAPPPPAAAEQEVVIPDETEKAEEKKKEEKKKEEKKPEEKKVVEKKPEEKKKEKPKDQEDFNQLLANLTKDQPAPETEEKPKKKATPAPAEPSVGPQAALITDGPPMTASENDAIRTQLIPCWNFDPGVPNPENYTVVVRITVQPDGRVSNAEVQDQSRMNDPTFRAVAGTALRSVQNPQCVPLRLPQGKYWPQMDIVFDLSKAIYGGY